MNQQLAHIALLVADYDEAINFYTEKLNFELIENTKLSDSKRWVMVKPKGEGHCCLLLAKAANDLQTSRIGNQTGGRVFLFLYTDNFQRDYDNLKNFDCPEWSHLSAEDTIKFTKEIGPIIKTQLSK